MVTVRPKTGSVIVEHPGNPVQIKDIVQIVRRSLRARTGKVSPVPATARPEGARHVSGPMLVLSGLYLVYLVLRRLFTPLASPLSLARRAFTLPYLLIVFLSLPIMRHSLDNLRRTGKLDMGLVSLLLLYASLFLGNLLSALLVIWLFNLSSWLETRVQAFTRRAVREMLAGNISRGWLVREDGVEVEVDTDTLQVGDLIALRTGYAIPVDGKVSSGQIVVNEASLTGEELPVLKTAGDVVYAGTLVEGGAARVRVTNVGKDTRLAAIFRLIEQAEQHTSQAERTSQLISQKMVPFAIGLAATAFLTTGNLLLAMTVLIVTCPCALRLSTSVAVSSALSNGAGKGIFIKGGSFVERSGSVNVLVLDKTGTLTSAHARVENVEVVDETESPASILQLCASIPMLRQHPYGRAVAQAAGEAGMVRHSCEKDEAIVGKGVRARVEGKAVLVGNRRLMLDNSVPLDTLQQSALAMDDGDNRLFVAREKQLMAAITVRSALREDIQEMVASLRSLGITTITILTGGREADVNGLQQQLGVDIVLSEQSPEEKAAWIMNRKLAHPSDVIAMVGDGVNDTPAFAASDLSIAVGVGGSDIAVEYADIVVRDASAEQLQHLFGLGRRTVEQIRENHFQAVGLNGLLLVLMLTGYINPLAGALLHNLVTVLVVRKGSKVLSYSPP